MYVSTVNIRARRGLHLDCVRCRQLMHPYSIPAGTPRLFDVRLLAMAIRQCKTLTAPRLFRWCWKGGDLHVIDTSLEGGHIPYSLWFPVMLSAREDADGMCSLAAWYSQSVEMEVVSRLRLGERS